MNVWLLAVLLVMGGVADKAHAQALWNGILDPTRAIDWTVGGVPGGIPSRTTICATIAPYSGTAATINTAISTCPAGQVVSLSAGTFNLTSSIDYGGRSNVTVRAAGANQTFLKFTAVNSCMYGTAAVCIANPNFPYSCGTNETCGGQSLGTNMVNWTAGYAQGTTVLTVSDGSIVPTDQIVFLDQLDDVTDPGNNTTPFISCQGIYILGATACATGRGGRPTQEQHRVVSKVGNQITIEPPISFTNFNAGKTPQMWWFAGSKFEKSSLEDVSIENLVGDSLQFSIVQMRGCIGCWTKNVRTVTGGRGHQTIIESIFSQVLSCYMYGTVNTSGGTTNYGVEVAESSYSRVENCIGQNFTSPYVGNGSVGTVWAYNYATRSIYDEVFPDPVTCPATGPGANCHFMIHQLFPTHAATTGMNLTEGNEVNGLNLDLAHGTGALTTGFRNRLYGYNFNSDNQNTIAMANAAFVRQTSLVGNVLGLSGYHTNYEDSLGPQGVQGNEAHTIYYLGYTGSGEATGSPGYDLRVVNSMLRWKNCDYATGTCRTVAGEVPAGHNPSTPSTTLPPSFYLTSAPYYFTNTGISWPPIGPDVTGGADPNGWAKHIPAQVCYSAIMGGPADGSGAVLAFDPATCYGTGGGSPPPPPPPTNTPRWSPRLNLRTAQSEHLHYTRYGMELPWTVER